MQPIRSLGRQLTHNSYEFFSHIVMLTLRIDNTFFRSSSTHKKVVVQSTAPTTIINKPAIPANNHDDKKYNIVMYGIKESPPKLLNLTAWKMTYNPSPTNLLKLISQSRPAQSRIVSNWANTNLMPHDPGQFLSSFYDLLKQLWL